MSGKLKILPRWIAALVLAAGASRASAQYADDYYIQSPGQNALLPRPRYIRTDVEAEQDTYRSGGSTQQVRRLYISTGVGVGWNGFLYHPYLLTYSLLFEPTYVWQMRDTATTSSQSSQLLLNGDFTANLLGAKPYATTLSYRKSHDEVKYDFFNSATVDSDSWGISTGYREGPMPVNVSFNQSHEDSKGLNQDSITDQSIFNLSAKNEREKDGVTDFNYQWGLFERAMLVSGANYRSANSYHRVNVRDSEQYEKSVLHSALLFNEIESSTSSSENLNATLNYNVRHSPHLHSYYNYAFSQFSGSDSDSIQNFATAGFNHQLYDSLSSGAEVHGGMLKSSSGGSTLNSYSGGTDANVNYNKRLGQWG
ncbi:MAG TPA: hypothetical protein VN516_00395, partial [Candidatus Baltobacteraceae bacterium]|nr:hypothetical protein [Candidatus Baltobacteraceae bacterium]